MDTLRLGDRFTLVKDEATWCGLVVTVGDARTSVVVKSIGGRYVIAAQVCPVRTIDPAIALQYNSVASRGALAIEHGATYVLRDIVDASTDIVSVIEELAGEAVRLRANAKRTMANSQVLSHYAD